jgi:uncharacterized protein YgfB (UPF0149 family)
MATTEVPDYDHLGASLAGSELAPSPAEAQAMLCGLFIVFRPDARQCWQAQLQAPPTEANEPVEPVEPVEPGLAEPPESARAPAPIDLTYQGREPPIPESSGATQRRVALEQLADWTESALDAQALAFDLLLPPEDRPLRERATAVHDWVRGLLYGLALGGLERERLEGPGREAFDDLVELTRMDLDAIDEGDVDEAALAEIIEFLRVAAMMIREEVAKMLNDERDRQAAEVGLH